MGWVYGSGVNSSGGLRGDGIQWDLGADWPQRVLAVHKLGCTVVAVGCSLDLYSESTLPVQPKIHNQGVQQGKFKGSKKAPKSF